MPGVVLRASPRLPSSNLHHSLGRRVLYYHYFTNKETETQPYYDQVYHFPANTTCLAIATKI